MKIALINPAPQYTGVGKYAHNLFMHLKNSIDYYYLNFEKSKIECHTRNGMTEISVRAPFKRRFAFNLAAIKHIPKKYDVYHISMQDFSYARLHPKIITCHDIVRRILPRNLTEWLQQQFLYSGIKQARHILADSENTKKDLINHLRIRPEKITVIPLGVDKQFRPATKKECKMLKEKYYLPDKKFILHISSEEPRKNYAQLLGAFAQIKEKFPEHCILKAGNAYPAYARKHENLIRKLNLNARVIRIPTIPEEDLPAFYSIADAFVLPSSYEGFGLPVLEAMACGCPTIAYNTSSIPEITGNAALLLPEGNIEELRNGIIAVLTDKQLRKTMRAKGLKQARKFTWKKCAQQTLKAYKN
ncbi:MAG: glycosyltransferase family 1 protein [Candidatus Woesearchaeota archaeon]